MQLSIAVTNYIGHNADCGFSPAHRANVSGSREYLNHRADEYTYMQIVYAIAFALMQIPSNASSSKPAR
ncbi:hypothetical protein MCOR08_001562 [Pyricularia oryzae]|nr:hypothetical protein MCOR08_001562 [Pyricularia oryzae]